MTIEGDSNTEDSSSKTSERKRSITKEDTFDLEIENIGKNDIDAIDVNKIKPNRKNNRQV